MRDQQKNNIKTIKFSKSFTKNQGVKKVLTEEETALTLPEL
jgi:hypothetical protein